MGGWDAQLDYPVHCNTKHWTYLVRVVLREQTYVSLCQEEALRVPRCISISPTRSPRFPKPRLAQLPADLGLRHDPLGVFRYLDHGQKSTNPVPRRTGVELWNLKLRKKALHTPRSPHVHRNHYIIVYFNTQFSYTVCDTRFVSSRASFPR